MNSEDFINFCDPLRKHELYGTILMKNFARKYPPHFVLLFFHLAWGAKKKKTTRVRAHVLFSTLPSQHVEDKDTVEF